MASAASSVRNGWREENIIFASLRAFCWPFQRQGVFDDRVDGGSSGEDWQHDNEAVLGVKKRHAACEILILWLTCNSISNCDDLEILIGVVSSNMQL